MWTLTRVTTLLPDTLGVTWTPIRVTTYKLDTHLDTYTLVTTFERTPLVNKFGHCDRTLFVYDVPLSHRSSCTIMLNSLNITNRTCSFRGSITHPLALLCSC